KWKPNPYAKFLKKAVTIRFDQDVIEYFKGLSQGEGMPYQTLMNLFLRYCKETGLKPKTNWMKNTGPLHI
ncbi:BrnA antitoxin family protein, partial [Candidatus Nomurabacteria bacterium]|nr:BrnA antitoxin family protein [Candidatus Nomurabacteria bacterium]